MAGRPSFRSALIAIVAIALIVRIVVVLATPSFVPQTDATDYDRIAVSLADTGSFPGSPVLSSPTAPSAFRPPLFPLTLAAIYKVVGTGSEHTRWEAGRIYEAILGAITVALIALIALRLFGRPTALLSGAIASVYPPLILIGSSLMTESLFIPLLLAAVLAALVHRESRHRWRWAVASGVLVGLAALTRSNGILLTIPLCFLVWTARPRWSRDAVAGPLALLASALVTVTPWTIRNFEQFHTFVPITTESGFVTAGTYDTVSNELTNEPAEWLPPVVQWTRIIAEHPGINEAQLSNRLNGLAVDYVEDHPAYVLKVAYWNTLRLLNLTGTGYERTLARYEAYPPELAVISVYAFWVLGLFALAGLATRAARRAPWAFWCVPLLVCVSTVVLIATTRYRSPADPFFVILAAVGLQAVARRVARPRVGARVPSATA
jgi:4-amino-4-deoxy-L-arabinose transferase-like glycosyltransferase